jgi:hypothetical protein
MGSLVRLLLTRILPARLAWVVAAFVIGRLLASRSETMTTTTTRRIVS